MSWCSYMSSYSTSICQVFELKINISFVRSHSPYVCHVCGARSAHWLYWSRPSDNLVIHGTQLSGLVESAPWWNSNFLPWWSQSCPPDFVPRTRPEHLRPKGLWCKHPSDILLTLLAWTMKSSAITNHNPRVLEQCQGEWHEITQQACSFPCACYVLAIVMESGTMSPTVHPNPLGEMESKYRHPFLSVEVKLSYVLVGLPGKFEETIHLCGGDCRKILSRSGNSLTPLLNADKFCVFCVLV